MPLSGVDAAAIRVTAGTGGAAGTAVIRFARPRTDTPALCAVTPVADSIAAAASMEVQFTGGLSGGGFAGGFGFHCGGGGGGHRQTKTPESKGPGSESAGRFFVDL